MDEDQFESYGDNVLRRLTSRGVETITAHPMRIYVAGPMGHNDPAETLHDVEAAMAYGLRIMEKGHEPYIPHLTWFMDQFARTHRKEVKWGRWIAMDLAYLSACHGLFTFGECDGEIIERSYAQSAGIMVWTDIDDIPVAGKPIGIKELVG